MLGARNTNLSGDEVALERADTYRAEIESGVTYRTAQGEILE